MTAATGVANVRRSASGAPRRVRRTIRGRLAALGLRALSATLRPLPDGPLHRVAHAIGGVLYLFQPARRRLVARNLERVVRHLNDHGMGGERVAAAARDRRALERLVRDAFGHYVRGYLEGAILPSFAAPDRLARVAPDDPAAASRAFGTREAESEGPLIVVGLHFGAIEVPAVWATHRLGRTISAPMETIADPDLQAYFVRTRGATGLRVIPLERAASTLRDSLAHGETVGLVADRPVGGGGTPVELFGAPARLPVGPAVLALDSGAPVWVVATRRVGWNSYRARLEEVHFPADGTRRQRLAGFMANMAHAFERSIADAPEQWWTAFFPIWEDIHR